jgi:hypothetical protein
MKISFNHLSFVKKTGTSSKNPNSPRVMRNDEVGIFQRLFARINTKYIGNNLFLGYCKRHRQYYVDYKHTDGNIRCLSCNEEWLIERGYITKQVPIRQRYWIRRKDGVKQRYWKIRKRKNKTISHEMIVYH